MTPIRFGRSGIEVSPLCMGTMTFGKEADAAACAELYAACRDAGIFFFDCADCYHAGESERILGSLIREHRSEVVITTKASFRIGGGPNVGGLSRRHLVASVERSLRHLQTDYIDLFFLHYPDPATPIEESLRAMDDLVAAGKVRSIGCSNFTAWETARHMELSDRKGWTGYHAIEPFYNLLKRQAEVEILPMAQHYDLAVMTYGPLAGGLLTGKYGDSLTGPGKSGRLTTQNVAPARYGQPWMFEAAQKLGDIGREVGQHPATLAVAWVKHHPAVTTPIIGARSLEQLRPSLAAGDYVLTDDLYKRLSALTPPPPPPTDRTEDYKPAIK